MLAFKSFPSFGTHTLLDKSLRVLQLPTHLSKLAARKSWLHSLGWKLIRIGWILHFDYLTNHILYG